MAKLEDKNVSQSSSEDDDELGDDVSLSNSDEMEPDNDDMDESGSGEDEEEESESNEDEGELDSDEQEDMEEEPEEEEESQSDDAEEGKSGWADAMAKVLSTGKASNLPSSKLLLSKAKLDRDKSTKVDDGEMEKPLTSLEKRAKRKEKETLARNKPNIVRDRARERQLNKVATRGVVQLFNAVREQQKNLKNELKKAGKSERKREKVFKNINKDQFIHSLGKPKADARSKQLTVHQDIKSEVKQEPADESTWKILKDDYMMGAKMKDWDKDSDSD